MNVYRKDGTMFDKLKSLLFEEEIELEEEAEELQVDKDIETKIEQETVSEEPVIELPTEKKTVTRIDVDPKPKQPKPEVKPTRVTLETKKPVIEESSFEYKPKAVISPMFGLTEAEMQRTVQLEQMSKRESSKSEDKSVLSPMFGEVKAQDPLSYNKPKAKSGPTRSNKVNMTLEEMLNLENQNEMEFTLFDVELDSTEFKSRENPSVTNDDQEDIE